MLYVWKPGRKADNAKDYPIDLAIGDGRIVMANPDDVGQADIVADTDGELKIRLDGQYLAQALKACGGMAELKLTNAYSPITFTVDGYQPVVMPMATPEATEQRKADAKTKAEKPTEQAEPTEPEVTKPVADKHKGKRSRAKEPVTA